MGLNNFSHDDSTDDDQSGSDEPGVSYLYIRGAGHKSNGKGHEPTARDRLRGEGEFTASLGVSEFAKNKLPHVKDQHDWFSRIVAATHMAINEDDYSSLFEEFFVDADVMAEYLADEPEERAALIKALKAQQDDSDSAESEAES